MKRILIISIVSLLLITEARAASIVIDGFYQGKDLYVKNPIGPAGVGFSVYEVMVNGEITSDEINSSAFIIDLHSLDLEIGDKVTVSILYHDDSTPKVLNPNAVLPQSTFEIVGMNLELNGVLKWTTNNEIGELPYKVQQFKWNKWITIGEVAGMGRLSGNSYSFQAELHSGRNTFRVAQYTSQGKLRYSENVYMNSAKTISLITELKKVNSVILFSDKTSYEIFDAYGRIVKHGYDSTIEVKKLSNGQYYLNYDKSFGSSFDKK
jgi:hypothetical protein